MNNCLVCYQDREITEEEIKDWFARGSYVYGELNRCAKWSDPDDDKPCKNSSCSTCQNWKTGYRIVRNKLQTSITIQSLKKLYMDRNNISIDYSQKPNTNNDYRNKFRNFITFVYNIITDDANNNPTVNEPETNTQDVGTNTDNSLIETINIDSANIYNAPVYNAPVYNYSNQQEELEQKDEELEQERDKTANLTIQLEQKDEVINNLTIQLEQKDEVINHLTIQNNQKEEINHLKEKNNHLISQLEQKDEELEQKDNAINNLTIQNNQKEAEINHLKEKNNNLMQRLNKLPILYGCVIVYLLVLMTIKIRFSLL